MAETTVQLPAFDFGAILKAIQLLAEFEAKHPNAIRDLIALIPAIIAVFAPPPAA